MSVAGCRCEIAANCATAQAQVEAVTFEVNLCNLHVPGRQDTTFFAWLARARPDLCSRVVVVTGDALAPKPNHVQPVVEKSFVPTKVVRAFVIVAKLVETSRQARLP